MERTSWRIFGGLIMIYQLNGTIIAKNGLLILIDVLGVGYGVLSPMSTVLKLPEVGCKVILHTHLIIREDAHALYGFLHEQEKIIFCEIIKISGFGPKLALAILSHLSVEQLIYNITIKDVSKLVSIPGVGQKTAERLLIEMQNKINNKKFLELIKYNNTSTIDNNFDWSKSELVESNIINDAEEALIALGYKSKEAILAINKIINNYKQDNNKLDSISSQQLIKLALKNLSKVYM